jgi:type IV pilus assembly protein PilW
MMETKKRTDTGFTLIELLVVLAISGLVMTAIFSTFRFQQQSYSLQRQMVAMEQNLRSAMIMMEKEIRMAGCDPFGISGAGIVTANANTIQFTMDLNYDSDVNDNDENITYSLYTTDNIQKLGRKEPADTNKAVAEHIKSLEFIYLDAGGAVTSTLSRIRSVQITLEAKTANIEPERTEQLTTLIKCRNLGL